MVLAGGGGCAAGWVPVAVAFFTAAGLVMVTGALPPREAYDHVEWPILIMIGALIPVSEALRTTGGTDLIAHLFESIATHGRLNLHAQVLYGRNDHHKIEALFKAFGRALDAATRIDERMGGAVPSTKGTL